MKKGSIIGYILLLVVIFSGAWKPLVAVLTWLVTQNMKDSGLSIVGEIFVKVATWFVSFGLVKAIFDMIGHYNKNWMSSLYFVISSILSLGLSYIVMKIEENLLIVSIVATVLVVAIILLNYIIYKRYAKQGRCID